MSHLRRSRSSIPCGRTWHPNLISHKWTIVKKIGRFTRYPLGRKSPSWPVKSTLAGYKSLVLQPLKQLQSLVFLKYNPFSSEYLCTHVSSNHRESATCDTMVGYLSLCVCRPKPSITRSKIRSVLSRQTDEAYPKTPKHVTLDSAQQGFPRAATLSASSIWFSKRMSRSYTLCRMSRVFVTCW